MNGKIKKTLSAVLSLAMLAGSMIMPIAADAAGETPLVAGDTVLAEWNLGFGTAPASGAIAVKKTAHIVMGDLVSGDETDYGFVGTYVDDFNFNSHYDGLRMTRGHVTNLEENENGVYSTGSEEGTNGYQYPIRFGLKAKKGEYFRVSVTLTTADETKNATDVGVWYERKHHVIAHETLLAGAEKTVDFSVDVEPVHFKSEGNGGKNFEDDMVNIVVLGDNVALKSMKIQKVEPKTTLWVLGDSTVTDGEDDTPYFELDNFTGVGSGISNYIRPDIAVSNQGEGGLNASDGNHFAIPKANMKEGDYLYVQYGHNHKEDGAEGYIGHLDKYYQACKDKKATLVLCSPINRSSADYSSSTNTWSAFPEEGFAIAAKGYVDCMLWGGETAANEYVTKFKSSREAAETYKKELLAKPKNSTVTNIAFVDVNASCRDWFSSITKSGTVAGAQQTNNKNLIYFYFQNSKDAKVDASHCNDAGSRGIIETFFHNSTAKVREYPALEGLLSKTDGSLPADTETPTGRHFAPVDQSIMDKGWAGGAGYPDIVSEYAYPVVVRRINLDDNNKLESVEIGMQDKRIMSTYGKCVIATYNNGRLKGAAVSNSNSELMAQNLVAHVDNSVSGVQTLAFLGSNLTIDEGDEVKAFVWSMDDDAIAMKPYTDGKYKPVEFDYLITNDSLNAPESFHYYGLKADNKIESGTNGWTIPSGVTLTSKNAGEDWYGNLSGAGSLTKALSSSASEGILRLEGRIKVTAGTANLQLVNGSNAVDCATISNAEASDWTDFSYELDMNKGELTSVIGTGAPVVTQIASYQKLLAGEVKPNPITTLQLTLANAANIDLTDLTVKLMARTEALPKHTVAADFTTGCTSDMGTLTVNKATAAIGSTVRYSAKNSKGYKFEGWYSDAAGTAKLGSAKNIDIRVLGNTTIYAKYTANDGVYFEDDFEEYDAGVKVIQGVASAPDDVELGELILSAGNRSSGGDNTSGIAVVSSDNNKYLSMRSGQFANSGRGASFKLAGPIELADLEGTASVWEFDVQMLASVVNVNGGAVSGSGTPTMTLDTDFGTYTNAVVGLGGEAWAKARVIIDKANKKVYFVVLDTEGNVKSITTKDVTDKMKITGMSFNINNQPQFNTVNIDNMKIYDVGASGTTATVPSVTTITAPAGALVTIAGNTYTVPESGSFEIGLYETSYAVTAECSGYDEYSDTLAVGSTHEITVPMVQKSTAKTSVTVNYLDENGTALKDPTVISKAGEYDIYVGDAFELTGDSYTKAILIKDATNAAMNDVYLYDADTSDSFTISALAPSNTINIKFKKLDGLYYCYNDTETTQSVSGANGTKEALSPAAIGECKKMNVSFDFKLASGKSTRAGTFGLSEGEPTFNKNAADPKNPTAADETENVVFAFWGSNSDGIHYSVGAAAGSSTSAKIAEQSQELAVSLDIDFSGDTGYLSGTIVNKATNATTTIPKTQISAKALKNMYYLSTYSAVDITINNFAVKHISE